MQNPDPGLSGHRPVPLPGPFRRLSSTFHSLRMVDPLHLRRRGSAARQPIADEWYIPYTKPATPPPLPTYPVSAKAGSSKLQSPSTTSFFHTHPRRPPAELTSFKFPPLPPAPSDAREAGSSKSKPRFRLMSKSASQSSLHDAYNSHRSVGPSPAPSGRAPSRVLYSPFNRTYREGSYLPPAPGYSHTRAISTPENQHRSRNGETFPGKLEVRKWEAPTICDKLMWARPSITPHVVTPPLSPEDVVIVDEPEVREREREDWSKYVQRGRSLSLGSVAPPQGAPLIGNARVREAEIERRNSVTPRRRRSSSFSRWIARHRASRSTDDLGQVDDANSTPRRFSLFRRFSTSSVRRRPSTVSPTMDHVEHDPMPRAGATSPYRSTDTQITRSSPELSRQSRRAAPGPPPRTLRLTNPPVQKQGVVIIGAEKEKPRNGADRPSRRAPRPPPLDFCKPLPQLPTAVDFGATADPPDEFSEIGQAISPRGTVHMAPSPSPVKHAFSTPRPQENGQASAHARAVLAQQHLKNRTKRAFQSPSKGPSSYRLNPQSPPNNRYSSSTSSTLSSVPVRTPTRRPTALEEAIGRSRASSNAGHSRNPSDQASPSIHEASPNPHAVNIPFNSAVSPPLGFPIITESEKAQNGGVDSGVPVSPPVLHAESKANKVKGKMIYPGVGQRWSREAEVGVIENGDDEQSQNGGEADLDDRFKVSLHIQTQCGTH